MGCSWGQAGVSERKLTRLGRKHDAVGRVKRASDVVGSVKVITFVMTKGGVFCIGLPSVNLQNAQAQLAQQLSRLSL